MYKHDTVSAPLAHNAPPTDTQHQLVPGSLPWQGRA